MRYTEYERMKYFRVGQAWSDRKLCAVRNVASLVAAVVVYELTVPITRRSLRSVWESDAMTQCVTSL